MRIPPLPFTLSRARVEGASRRSRRAFSMAEMVITALIVGGALVPMYFLFTGSSKSVFRSKISYMAMHVAREELEALRQVDPKQLPAMRHDWEPVKGTALRRVLPPGGSGAVLAGGGSLDYPPDYERIETKVSVSSSTDVDPEVGAPAHPRLYKVLLQVRWQEMGKSEEEGGAGHRTALSRFQTVIADHRVK